MVLQRKKMYMLVLITMLFVAACGNNETKDEQAAPEREDPSQEQKEQPTFAFPLTGMKAEEEVKQRAVAVTVNNHPAARPQSGLSQADLVYELLAEGSVTRFLAIFQRELPARIGPVRSARDYFIDIAKGFDSLYIAHGYSPSAKKRLSSGEIDQLNGIQYDGTLFKRSSDRQAPHNSYISKENIVKGADQEGFALNTPPTPIEFLSDDEIAKLQGEQSGSIQIAYSQNNPFISNYEYDQETGKYARSANNEPTTDMETNDQIVVDNLIVLVADHEIIDSEGRRTINLTSGGKALLFQKGLVREVEWKDVEGRPTPYEDGLPSKLVPGKSWVSIVPSLDIVSYTK